ncbi:hypothetical protein F7725_025649 [Dissostichus mawsoni]|uniref:Uncharacterized protein n=1 Tax=Dissostichus mawsoni TaxID=36200 RepID=A0A7J5XBS6_DISMA|nr:hypothetical protein F7725_025649 [Dissostichus mawsoni]
MALHPDTEQHYYQPTNQSDLSLDKGLRTNQLSVWIFWGNEQPISSLSGLHGVTAWPMSAAPRGERLPRPNQRLSAACRCRRLVVRSRCSASGPDREPGDVPHQRQQHTDEHVLP